VKKIDPKDLPRDLDQCHALIAELVQDLDHKERKLRRVQHQLEKLLRWRYGPKRERVDPNQLFLFGAAMVESNQDIVAEPPEPASDEPKPIRRKGHGRQRLPADVERRREEYDLPEDQKVCPHCEAALKLLGEEKSEQWEYVPASLLVIEQVCKKYACPKGCTVATAPKPMQPIEKGLAGPGLLAHVTVSKYADHQPLFRQEEMFKRQGVNLSRKTMCDWMRRGAELLMPLFVAMRQRVLMSKALQTDDTPVAVLDPELPRTRTGRIWTYVGDKNHPFTVYDYTPNRSRDGPDEFLKEFSGHLQADAYSGYDQIYTDPDRDVTEVACWAHTRRKFFEAQSSDLMRSMVMMAFIRLLYDVEREARDRELDSAGRLALRQEKSVPILDDIEEYLRREQTCVLPKEPIAEAIGYALNNWTALRRYAEDGDLEIDNNGAERSLRGVAVGRKNWMFFGSDRGGQTAAVLTSFIASCKRLHIDPFLYLRDVIARISAHPANRIEELLPDAWKAAREAAGS
jgi:transposase